MKKAKRIVAGFLALVLLMGMGVSEAGAEEPMIEKPYLGLDPSTVIDSEAEVPDIPDMEAYSGSSAVIQMEGSKKGIHGSEWMSAGAKGMVGVKHVLLNLGITQFLSNGDTEYTYNGKTYMFNSNYSKGFEKTVRALNAKGVTVTTVLLVQDDRGLKEWEDLVYNSERGHNFYALSTKTEEARDTWSALFGFLAEKFGQPGCFIENWILGNEVNMPSAYNWTGTLSPSTNAKVYAQSFILLYNALQEQNVQRQGVADAKAYISLDRSWNNNGNYTGIGAKDFLDRFAAELNVLQPDVNWCVAFHPYAVVMDPTSNKFTESEKLLWGNNKYTPNNLNAQFVTAANLNVLTDYVKNTYGAQHRIILSEQGFDAKGGEDYQAASLAYTFYAGQFNDMVDAVIFRSWEDNPDEMGLQLGILGRKAYQVFKYMDTNIYGGATNQCLNTIGIQSWKDIVKGFDMHGMGYRDVSYDSWYLDAVKAVNDAGWMTGLNETNFGAGENLGRGQFATILYRMEGSPQQGYVNKFIDVPDHHFFSIPVSWANSIGIITGYGHDNLFGTGDNITREQLATLIYRYAQYKGKDTDGRADMGRFSDGKNVSGFAAEAMQWIVSEGIIQGEGTNGQLNPQGQVSRAVCATIIQRYSGL
ncbi:DUF5722 domain-containing protein [Muricomes sp. OA1]|uniref:S-layer homology domain-containing protein n=1 Tax=Hungatella hathewayi TaxID=154046 RepID=A0A3E2WKZ3_9FIRM|nr:MULTISPECIES: DUF5722 domain-containing protein [Clostridia]MCH1974383.1 DUF5722 domain-containing protein [Muricomes sp. OA1]RGC27713.1 S-layer homology domain-containing protein [Hungatella hathewayi]GKH33162.1 hypothetical protein CE91St64_25690 [Faecalicatena contorta]